MERNDVIKALECHLKNEKENTCGYCTNCPASADDLCEGVTTDDCVDEMFTATILLINELTEKIEDLTETVKVRGETIEKLQFLTNEIEEDNRKLTEEKERLMAYNENLTKANTHLSNNLWDEVAQAKDLAISDTLSDFKNRLTRAVGTYTNESYVYVYAWFKLIDQIVKEMLEGV